MERRFEAGAYQADEQKDFTADKEALKSIIKVARDSDIDEDKQNKRKIAKELLAHGLVDRDFILELLEDNGADEATLKEWEEKVLTTEEIIDTLIPLPAEVKEVESETTDDKGKTPPDYGEIEIAEEDMPTIVEIDGIILPTDEEPRIRPGETEYEPPKTIPRTNMLIGMLGEYGIKPDEYMVASGRNSDDVVRKESYKMFLLPSIDKMVTRFKTQCTTLNKV